MDLVIYLFGDPLWDEHIVINCMQYVMSMFKYSQATRSLKYDQNKLYYEVIILSWEDYLSNQQSAVLKWKIVMLHCVIFYIFTEFILYSDHNRTNTPQTYTFKQLD